MTKVKECLKVPRSTYLNYFVTNFRRKNVEILLRNLIYRCFFYAISWFQ